MILSPYRRWSTMSAKAKRAKTGADRVQAMKEAELLVIKNRHGPEGWVDMDFTPETMRFEEA